MSKRKQETIIVEEEVKGLPYDIDNEYSVSYFWGTVGIVYDKTQVDRLKAEYPILKDKKLIFCSDAHYLDKIPDAQNFFAFEKGLTDDQIRQKIIDYLK